jgi:hypothetical protein
MKIKAYKRQYRRLKKVGQRIVSPCELLGRSETMTNVGDLLEEKKRVAKI